MRWLDALFRKQGLDAQLDKEIEFHVDELTRDNIAAGLDPTEARRRAIIAFGGLDQIKEECREARGLVWFESVIEDIRFGARLLRKDRGYTLTAIVALAIGISANTALFSLFNSVVLRPMPVPNPDRLAAVYRTTARTPFGPFSYFDYVYYRDHNNSFSGVAASYAAHLRLSGSLPSATETNGPSSLAGILGPSQFAGVAEPVAGLFVSGNYFSVMSVNAIAGRTLAASDDQNSGPPYSMMLSENFWERRFARDANIVGKQFTISGVPALVVGITPRDFMGERPSVPDVWLPLAAQQDPQRRLQDRNVLCCQVEARLKPDLSLSQVQADISLLTNTLHQEFTDIDPQSKATVQAAVPFGTNRRGYETVFFILQPAIALVLLIACANVAGLLLGRATVRQREIAVRLALGATRARLVRQLISEGVLLAQAAGVVSILFTWWLMRILVQFVSSTIVSSGLSEGGSLTVSVTPDRHVFLYTFGIACVTGVAFALLPALQVTKPDLISSLKEEGGVFVLRRKSHLRSSMVAIQIAVCLMLLIGAGMLAMSSLRLLSINPGFQTNNVLNVSVLDPSELGYSVARTSEIRRALEDRLRALPGVESIASASRVPLGSNVTTTMVDVPGAQTTTDARASDRLEFPFSLVSPEYFSTLGIPLVHGRVFTADEMKTRAPVVVISESLTRRLWPNEDAIGKRVIVGSQSATHFQFQPGIYSESCEVVGVVRDIHSVSPILIDPGAAYLPQPPEQWNQILLIRTKGDPKSISASLVNEVKEIDPSLSISLQTLDQTMADAPYFVIARLGGVIFAVIGLLGLLLASVGIYSMVGYSVSQHTKEIGVRMALGARPINVVLLMLRRSSTSIILGVGGGILLGVLLSKVLSSLLEGLTLLDPLVLAAIALILAFVALAAAYLPARRAAKIDPVVALRS
jgi:putative ABC transport system permease protein